VRAAQLVGPSGWIPVDPQTMEVKSSGGEGRVFAIGDVTSVPLLGRFKPEVGLSLPKAGVIAEGQGEVVAQRIADFVGGRVPTAPFGGIGNCFLETSGGNAVKGEVSFFASPHPVMDRQTPSTEQFTDKLAWVAQHLAPSR
jgi:sulfide:quinone oxidoreductase